jgi:hypothetical protein
MDEGAERLRQNSTSDGVGPHDPTSARPQHPGFNAKAPKMFEIVRPGSAQSGPLLVYPTRMLGSKAQPTFDPATFDACPRCGGPGSARFSRRVLLFEGLECRGCRHVQAYPMRTVYVAGCAAAPVVPAVLGSSWLALLLGIVAATLLLLDLRLRVLQQKTPRSRPHVAIDAELEPPPELTNVSAIDIRRARSAQSLVDWTLTSSVVAAFLASPFLSEIVMPLPHGKLVISISVWRQAALPKLTSETSTWVAFWIYAYFVALAWFAIRLLSRALRISSRSRWLYLSLSLLPGINVIALSWLSRRAKADTHRATLAAPTQG